MHFHLPKPLHGWREFAGEVRIIVLGVLIALGFEQIVETIRGNTQVREFRSAANDELAHDMAAYEKRLALGPCVKARLLELDHLIASDHFRRCFSRRSLYSRWPTLAMADLGWWVGRFHHF